MIHEMSDFSFEERFKMWYNKSTDKEVKRKSNRSF